MLYETSTLKVGDRVTHIKKHWEGTIVEKSCENVYLIDLGTHKEYHYRYVLTVKSGA